MLGKVKQGLLLLQECGPLHGRGMVMQVLDKSFDVLMEELGIIKRVYCDVCTVTTIPQHDCGVIFLCINRDYLLRSTNTKRREK